MMLDKNPSPRKRRMAPRAAEMLEDRVLLSGNVAAMISHDSLIIKGDAENNQLEIAIEEGNLVVRGLDGTTINGSDSFVALENTTRIPKNMVAQLGAGDDTLLVQPGVEIGRKLKIVDRDGATTIGVQDTLIGGSFVLRTGESADSVSIAGTHIGRNAVLVSGKSDDLISISETTIARSLRISTRQGDDDLVLQQTDVSKNARIRTGSGNDDVVIQQSTVDRHMIVGTWLGDDFLMLEQTTVGRHTHLRLAPGNDQLIADDSNDLSHRFGGSWFKGHIPFDGYAGLLNFTGRRDYTIEDQAATDAAIEQHVTDSETGAVARAEALRIQLGQAAGAPLSIPTIETDANLQTIQSNGTLLTKLEILTIEGDATPLTRVEIDADGDGEFDDGSAIADENGRYSLDVTLLPGQQTLRLRSANLLEQTDPVELIVHRAVGTVVRFDSSLGSYDIELFDADAPLAVANFLNYLTRYEDSIIHRAPPDFVIQGGGYVFDGSDLVPLATDAPIVNEFDPNNSNLRGTLSMALLANQPNSGTSGWFINVVDNAALDAAFHTVFGQVIGTGMDVVDAIADVPLFNLNPFGQINTGAFATIPLRNYTPLSQALTGTVSVAVGGDVVLGTGTRFASQLEIGERIRIAGQNFYVLAIISETELQLSLTHSTGATDVAALINPDPDETNLVLFGSISEILGS